MSNILKEKKLSISLVTGHPYFAGLRRMQGQAELSSLLATVLK